MAGCTAAPFFIGGAAGGAIKLSLRNSCEINGTISANGLSGGSGGSGGSILISAGQTGGSGKIFAHGGDSETDGAGGGGGGRIAIHSSALSFSGTIAAYGGKASLVANYGGPGTIYTEDSGSSFTSLRIDNGNGTLARSGLRAYVTDNLSPISFSEVVIGGGAELEFSGVSTTSVVISTLNGDLTGNIVVVGGQTFDITNLTSTTIATPTGFGLLSSSLTVVGMVNLPSSVAIPSTVRLDAQGTVCGISKMMILEGGTCRLGAGGRSCGMGIGTFAFDVIVLFGGTLTNLTSNVLIPTVSGQVCAMHGSVVQNVNATQLWNEDTSELVGSCVEYIPSTTSASSATTASATTATTGATTDSSTATTASSTSSTTGSTASTIGTSTIGTSTTGTPVVLPGMVPQPSVNASRRFVIIFFTFNFISWLSMLCLMSIF